MNWNEIGRQLRLMQAIVDEAQHAEKMSDLERDLLLETLRKCYTEIKFGAAEVVKEEMVEVVAPVAAPAAAVAAVVAEKEIEEEVVVEPEVEAEPEIEVEPEPEPEPEIEIEPEPTPEPEPEIEVEPEPTPEPEEVFTSVRHKLDRKTIRSLYFDDAPAESAQEVDKEFYAPVKEETPQEEPAPVAFEITEEEPVADFAEEEPAEEKVVYIADDEEEDEEPETPASIFEITDEEPEEESAELPFSFREAEESAEAVKESAEAEESAEAVKEVAEESAEEVATTIADAVQPVTVLGDVMGAERTTIADSIAPSEDVATVIGGRQLSSLRGAIGLNDKFLLIRDLFGGDNSAYEAAIDGLDGCENLDDAMLYIFDNIEWNGESDGAQLLTELLSRRFQ